ncbi:hypothetical protein [Duganella callida]|uniref:CopG family transcriptional regulator n=1 Tax=Duganella callida TaxID=2561932 RepID=A0A4Y9S354_9BURK|nr:hypothetical protein [Duganella callida]TFW15935.1 hypothetical protein E4L98_24890 [Duganella callida]
MNRNKMPKPRVLVAKALFNEDEYRDFSAACAEAGESQSRTLRQLANDWSARFQNDRRRGAQTEWPKAGQNMAMFLPGRANFSVPRHHMRM